MHTVTTKIFVHLQIFLTKKMSLQNIILLLNGRQEQPHDILYCMKHLDSLLSVCDHLFRPLSREQCDVSFQAMQFESKLEKNIQISYKPPIVKCDRLKRFFFKSNLKWCIQELTLNRCLLVVANNSILSQAYKPPGQNLMENKSKQTRSTTAGFEITLHVYGLILYYL